MILKITTHLQRKRVDRNNLLWAWSSHCVPPLPPQCARTIVFACENNDEKMYQPGKLNPDQSNHFPVALLWIPYPDWWLFSLCLSLWNWEWATLPGPFPLACSWAWSCPLLHPNPMNRRAHLESVNQAPSIHTPRWTKHRNPSFLLKIWPTNPFRDSVEHVRRKARPESCRAYRVSSGPATTSCAERSGEVTPFTEWLG